MFSGFGVVTRDRVMDQQGWGIQNNREGELSH